VVLACERIGLPEEAETGKAVSLAIEVEQDEAALDQEVVAVAGAIVRAVGLGD
jgi:hypothetical protein